MKKYKINVIFYDAQLTLPPPEAPLREQRAAVEAIVLLFPGADVQLWGSDQGGEPRPLKAVVDRGKVEA